MFRSVRFLLSVSTIAIVCIILSFVSLSSSDKTWHIAVLYWSMNIPGQVAMRAGLESEAASFNAAGLGRVSLVTYVAGDGDAGIENQIKQMRAAIASKVDAIIVQPTDNAGLAAPLKEANAAGIPVVAYDQYISGGKLSAYRTSDNYSAGRLDGEYLSSRFPAGKQIRIILVEYSHVSSTVERVDGFLDGLSSTGRSYKLLKSYTAVEPVGGAKAARDIIHDFPAKGSVDAIFTVNDGGGLAVVKGLLAAGRNEILVATVDGDPASVAAIRDGRMIVVDSAQFCGPLGAEAFRTACSILAKKKVPYHALVPVFPVTRETLNRYPGWKGPIPADFTKPWPSKEPQWSGKLKVVRE